MFRFELNPALAPGQYRIYARYKSGGEVSQVAQNFTVKAGAQPEQLAARGGFTLTNTTPWEYQWLQAETTVSVLPGDRWLEINNTGKADGAKVFDAFLLKLETPLGDVMDAEQAQAAPTPLKAGVPEAWLVGGLQDGLAGVSMVGLDSEAVLRPNPGQPYLSLQMMGGEMRTWRVATTQASGSADIEASTQHSYGWSRGSGYAHLYLHADQATQALLHLQQSGIRTFGWLDGQPLQLANDPKPPAGFSSSLAHLKIVLHGLTTEGLVAKALPEQTEALASRHAESIARLAQPAD